MKLLRILAISLALVLAGCAALPFTEEAAARELMSGVAQFYTTDARVLAGGVETRAHIHRPGPDVTRVEVLAPESLAGLEYSFRPGGVELSFGELSFGLDSSGGALSLPVVPCCRVRSVASRMAEEASGSDSFSRPAISPMRSSKFCRPLPT